MTLRIGDRVEVPAYENHFWQGVGKVVSLYPGGAIVKMETGRMAGEKGGFSATGLIHLEPASVDVDVEIENLRDFVRSVSQVINAYDAAKGAADRFGKAAADFASSYAAE